MKHALLVSVVSSLVLAVPGTAQGEAGNGDIRKSEVRKVETFELNKTVKKVEAIDINTADAKTIAKTLDIDEQVAEAVVARRTKLGPLESTDDLLVVPGVSRAKVTANFARLGLPQGKLELELKPAKETTENVGGEAEKKKTEATTDKVKKDLDKPIKK